MDKQSEMIEKARLTYSYLTNEAHDLGLEFSYDFIKDRDGRITATRCKLTCCDVAHYGVALRSPDDNLCKLVGKTYALARALRAYKKGKREQFDSNISHKILVTLPREDVPFCKFKTYYGAAQ